LPNTNFSNDGRRAATLSIVEILDKRVGIASLHLETMVMRLPKRTQQLERVIDVIGEIEPDIDHVIIGGDFNSFFKKDKRVFNTLMDNEGYKNITPDDEHTDTSVFGIIKSRLDYIYCKGCHHVSSGIGSESDASDRHTVHSVMKLLD